MTITSTIVATEAPAPVKIIQTLPQPWRETPLIESPTLSKLAGCRIFLKLDNLQPSGSFKSRGIGNLVRKAILRSPPHTPLKFYASSGGNAGLACVTAATTLGYPSLVVVPLSTRPAMITKLRAAGASDVVQHGKTLADADAFLREELLPLDPNGVYVPPFDHPDIWEGAESLADELVDQMGGAPDAVVCSVGGGGLMVGICQGLARRGYEGQVPIVAVETAGAESLHTSMTARELVTLPGITSLATSLGCVRVARRALDYALKGYVRSVVVSDREAVEACVRFADDERIVVEPACGATLAMVYSGRLGEVLDVKEGSRVVLEVCGGSNVSVKMLEGWREMYGL
ncbi:hypothetical protein IAT38_005844 [Cryptococcus sp. DSM 104549]